MRTTIFLNESYGLDRLGRGTFGTVVKAFDRRSGSPVAVKIIKLEARGRTAEEEEQKRATIKREVDLLARIQHVSCHLLRSSLGTEADVVIQPNIVTMETAMVENDCVCSSLFITGCSPVADPHSQTSSWSLPLTAT